MIFGPLIFLSLNFSNLIPDIDVEKIINSATSGSAMEIAADSSFTNKTLKFNAGQTIYVRVTVDNDGQDKHVLNLRDNNYNLITTYSMTKSGNQFQVNFPAPAAAGIYSLEANIVSSGSVANFVQTIEVGDAGSQNSQVNVKINNQVNTGPSASSGLTSKDNQPSNSPEAVLGEQASQSQETQGFFAEIWSKIIEFFKGVF